MVRCALQTWLGQMLGQRHGSEQLWLRFCSLQQHSCLYTLPRSELHMQKLYWSYPHQRLRWHHNLHGVLRQS